MVHAPEVVAVNCERYSRNFKVMTYVNFGESDTVVIMVKRVRNNF